MARDDQVLAALGRALKLEQDGYAFYTQAAERVRDATCKQTMRSLAEDEKVHEAMIVRQLEAMSEEGDFVVLPNIEPVDADLSEAILPPDPDRVAKRVGENPDELEALLMAIEIEVRSYDLYRQAAQDTESEAGREMYEWLAAAEMAHFNLLMSNYEALNTPSSWV
jgi:rubrerythrin